MWLGRRLDDRYALQQRIGNSSLSSVYRATRRHLERSFAVKIVDLDGMPTDRRLPDACERIEREVRILGRTRSPHVVDICDLLAPTDETIAVVMDCVHGETLEDCLEREMRLPPDELLRFGLDVASGLRDVHRRGAVHRDIKPDNIMLSPVGGGDEIAVLIDFGLVQLHRDTGADTFVGTPMYASPEQVRGKPVDARSDLYSLGLLLFRMFTGRPAFLHRDISRLLWAQHSAPAPRLADVTPERPHPDELESLVASLLAKSPERRPGSALDVIRRLEQCRDGLGVSETNPADDASCATPDREPEAVRTAERDADSPDWPSSTSSRSPEGAHETERIREGSIVVRADEHGEVTIRRLGDADSEEQVIETGAPVVAMDVCTAGLEVIAIGRSDGTVSLFVGARELGTSTCHLACEEPPDTLQLSDDGHVVTVAFGSHAEWYAVSTGNRLDVREGRIDTLDSSTS